jgi:hypothetical protein
MRIFREQPTWGMFIALFAAFFACIITLTVLFRTLQHDHDGDKERDFINRSVSCMDLIIDNDREFLLTAECVDPGVVAWYPPQVCDELPAGIKECGSKQVSGLGG